LVPIYFIWQALSLDSTGAFAIRTIGKDNSYSVVCRNSSMKSEVSKQGPSRQPRTVQFSPDTVTVKVPSSSSSTNASNSSNSLTESQQQRLHKMISYNRWIGVKPPPMGGPPPPAVLLPPGVNGGGGGPGGLNPYLESSFTGQPIAMLPPGVVMTGAGGLHHHHHHQAGRVKTSPVMAYPPVDDVPRKWTEKKKVKWRSRSTPRSSEIDEIIGSSRTKAPNRWADFVQPEPQREAPIQNVSSQNVSSTTRLHTKHLRNTTFI
jgi:hypothetical protein